MVSTDLGALGPSKSEPVIVQWRWYYYTVRFLVDVGGWVARRCLPGCLLIVILLVLVKENRHRQAWFILVPFFLLGMVLLPMLRRWLFGSDEALLLWWLVTAWTAVWLVSPWLAWCRPILAFCWALVLGTAVGAAGAWYGGHPFGIYLSLACTTMPIFSLLFGLALAATCCRKSYTPRRFLAWFLLWLLVGVMLCVCGGMGLEAYRNGGLLNVPLVELLPSFVLGSLCAAGFLLLLNVPFMILAFQCPLYCERFHKVLRLPAYVPPGETRELASPQISEPGS